MRRGNGASRRVLVAGALAISLLFVWTIRPLSYANHASNAAPSSSGTHPPSADYFEQAYSVSKPKPYAYAGLEAACSHVEWTDDAPYLNCVGMLAGITSMISQVKTCLKMAVDTGSHLVLPQMPLRDSHDLTDFNFFNPDAYMAYDKWFDASHLRDVMGRACPRMKIAHPSDLDTTLPVRNRWAVSVTDEPKYLKAQSFFWVGRPYAAFFEERYRRLRFLELSDPERDLAKQGVNVVDVDAEFLLFRITDDATGRELALWNDLAAAIRFRETPRRVVHGVLAKMRGRSFYGVHFRVESDTIWSSLETQLQQDLDALDRAWLRYGEPGHQKPLVYLACGDEAQIEKFVVAGRERGWEVTHKWRLARDDLDTTSMINGLPFDFQGLVDMGVMIQSQFFLGLTGSAFSVTVANLRDVTGRYRGSSFDVWDDEGAMSHLFFEGDTQYACCL